MRKAIITLSVFILPFLVLSLAYAAAPKMGRTKQTGPIQRFDPTTQVCPPGCKGEKGDPGEPGPQGPEGQMGSIGPASCEGEGCLVEKIYFTSVEENLVCNMTTYHCGPPGGGSPSFGPLCNPGDTQLFSWTMLPNGVGIGPRRAQEWIISEFPPLSVYVTSIPTPPGPDYLPKTVKRIATCSKTSDLLP